LKKIILILVLLAVVAGAVIVFILRRPAPAAADLLPGSTLVFLRVPNFVKAQTAFQQTSAFALWQEPVVRAALDKPLRALDQAAGTRYISDNKTARDVFLDAMQGEVFVAVTQISPFGPFQSGLAFGTDTKSKLLQTKLVLAHVERELKKQPNIELTEKKYLGVTYTAWRKDPAVTICYTFLNSLLVGTVGENTMRDIIAQFTHNTDGPPATIAASQAYQNFSQRLPAEAAFVAYINPQPITVLLGPLLAFQAQGAGVLSQLAAIQATGLSVHFERGLCRETRLTQYKPDSHQPTPPVARKTIALTTPQTLLYSTRVTNLAQTYDELTSALTQTGLLGVNDSIARFEQSTRLAGLRFVEDVLAKLGPETSLILQWRDGAEYPDVAFVAEIRDAATTRPLLDQAINIIKRQSLGDLDENSPWDESTAGSHTLRTVRFGASKVAPSYVVTDEFFILALTPDFTRELLAQASGSQPNLTANATYQQAIKSLPTAGTSFHYLDLRALYPRLHTLVQGLPANELFDLRQLPAPATVTPHLSPFASVAVDTPAAAITTSDSPIGTPVALIAILGAAWLGNQTQFNLPLGEPTTSSSTPAPP